MPKSTKREQTLDMEEFLVRAPETLKEFAIATRAAARTDPDMNPSQARTESWWWRDVAAFLQIKRLTAKKRSSNGVH